jgi:hypothetical protein
MGAGRGRREKTYIKANGIVAFVNVQYFAFPSSWNSDVAYHMSRPDASRLASVC